MKGKIKMQKLILITCACLVSVLAVNAQQKDFLKLTGPYLGQKPPVNEPILFAPGIVSNARSHSSVAISPDGTELYWRGEKGKIWFTVLESGWWKEPDSEALSPGRTSTRL